MPVFSNVFSSSRRSRSGRRRKPSLFGKLVAGTAIAAIPVVGAGIGIKFATDQANIERIDANYCYTRDDQHIELAFVDFSHTGDMSGSQERDMVNWLYATYDNLPANAEIRVFTTASDVSATVIGEPDIVICAPATDSRDLAAIGAPISNTAVLGNQRREADEAFEAQVERLFARSQSSTLAAQSSPILEQIQALSRVNHGGRLAQVHLFTDGLNNSRYGRFCSEQGHLPRFSDFAQRPEYQSIRPDDFGGADINLMLVQWAPMPNDVFPYCSDLELANWWREFFEANGAGTVRLTPLGYGSAS